MEKKITFKTIYLLLVITIGLLGLGLGSTYAMFTKEAEIDNPITFTSNLSYDSDVIETIDLILKPTEIKDFSLTVNNNTGVVTNYAIAYIDENYNIDIYGKLEDSTCKSIGTLENSKACLFNGTVRNDGSEEIILTIAILSSDSSLILASNMETIPLRENLVTHITNLYTNAIKTKVTNNSIEYNYATSESLMNDRLGGTTTSLDEGNIRYYGANPNNYIYFNCSDYSNQSASSCELWRIIGIFDGKVKIIRNDGIGKMAWDETNSNNWARPATLNTYLNGEYYNNFKNDETRNKIVSSTWNLGGVPNTYFYSNQMYSYERGKTVPTGAPTTWTGKIALMYPSDYGYSADFNKCSGNSGEYNQSSCMDNNWLWSNISSTDWTDLVVWMLTSSTRDTESPWIIDDIGNARSATQRVTMAYPIRPTLYLNPDELIQDGTGEERNPYQLSNSYGKYFNGESDYVDMGFKSQNLGQSITLGARFKPDGYKSSLSYVVTNVETAGIGLYIDANGCIIAFIWTDTMSGNRMITSSSVVTNKYYTALVTYDGNLLKLYIDGKEVGSASVTGNIKVTPVPFYVGANPNVSSVMEYFKGRISDAFVTREVLDATTIANNFTNTFIYDENDSTYFYYHEH